MPARPPAWAKKAGHVWMAEAFAGKAGATLAHVEAGGWALPPIEFRMENGVARGTDYSEPQDILEDGVVEKLIAWMNDGVVR